ncbi:MAG: GxxExxY protein [Acidobacteria bacterium]|nr:GxxExxY protein [Acidobacteriota bacterium]
MDGRSIVTTKRIVDELTYKVVGAAIEVHKELGPGLLETVYHDCIKHEFLTRGMRFVSERSVPVEYKGLSITTDLRCDLVVEDLLIVELKAVTAFLPVHQAQLYTYMKLLKLPKGLLINFHSVNIFREGQKTLVNELYRQLPDG